MIFELEKWMASDLIVILYLKDLLIFSSLTYKKVFYARFFLLDAVKVQYPMVISC